MKLPEGYLASSKLNIFSVKFSYSVTPSPSHGPLQVLKKKNHHLLESHVFPQLLQVQVKLDFPI